MIFGKHVNKFYLRYWYLLIGGIVSLLAVDYFQLLIPDIIGNIIDGLNAIINNKPIEEQLTLVKLKDFMLDIMVIAAVMFSGRFLWRITIFTMGVNVESDLRDEMFVHSEKLSREYYNTHKVGEEMALYTNDLQTIRQTFGSGIMMMIDALFLGTLSFVKMVKIDFVLTIISCIPLIVIVFFSGLVGRVMSKKFEKRQKAYAELTDFTQENFTGITVVKAFVKELKEIERFAKINKKNKKRNIEFVKFSMLLQVAITVLLNSVVLVIILFSGYKASHGGDFSIGNLTRFISYFNTLTWPMMAIGQLINIRSQGKASLNRIDALLDYPVEIKDEEVVDVEIKGEIIFNNLNFSYPGSSSLALENINLNIQKGTSVGILGKTGSGKTTLVDMLLRIYNVDKGSIFIDGVDIMNVGIENLRSNIGYVPQDNFLFSKTVLDNICFSENENDLEKAKLYAKYASVDTNIEDFPNKYDTVLGERGVTLSGGQRQRVSIARAMYKDPAILILDDSVSAVDTETERKILGYLKNTRENKTTILVAHRISTVKDMDLIVVIDEGKIIAKGKHEELLQTSEAYKEMVLLQQLDEEEGVSHE